MSENHEDGFLEEIFEESISGTGNYDQSEDVYSDTDSSDRDFWQEPDETDDE